MSLNEERHDRAWSDVWESYYERYKLAGIEEPVFRAAIKESTYLFNEAEAESDFADALFQMREILEMRLRGVA